MANRERSAVARNAGNGKLRVADSGLPRLSMPPAKCRLRSARLELRTLGPSRLRRDLHVYSILSLYLLRVACMYSPIPLSLPSHFRSLRLHLLCPSDMAFRHRERKLSIKLTSAGGALPIFRPSMLLLSLRAQCLICASRHGLSPPHPELTEDVQVRV
jgi:hypothetical protein